MATVTSSGFFNFIVKLLIYLITPNIKLIIFSFLLKSALNLENPKLKLYGPDDLSRTIDSSDEQVRFKILLEMLISNEASFRVILDAFIDERSKGDPEVIREVVANFQISRDIHREKIINRLYEAFGKLPDDLLE